MPNHSPEDIIRVVDRLERGRSDLHDRMDKDFDRYTLKSYQGETDESGQSILDGYKKFTSNDPATTMNLGLHLGSTAQRIIRVHQPRAQRNQREMDNQKELFCLGILKAADERRSDLMMQPLQDSLFGQALIRGRYAQRVLLVREEVEDRADFLEPEFNTYVDITDWDPRNTYWSVGKHGLSWACNKSWKTRNEILEEYDVDPEREVPSRQAETLVLEGDEDEREYAVYDWFDSTDNIVVLEGGRELKERTPHGMGRVPVSLGLVGPLPIFQAKGEDYDVHYGEGFYKADREIFDQQNFMYSVMAELSKRSIKQPLMVKSRDGSLSLDEDPRVSGTEVSLSSENEEDIAPLPPMEMVRESGTFLGLVSSMMQRGTFPNSAFGELAFQLSGFAITQLRQGLEAPLTPFIRAVEESHKEILNILCDAYATGFFDPMELSGRMQDPQRTFFSEQIQPELVRNAGTIEVNLVAQLPQDDASKMTLAQLAREGPVPMLDDRFIRENILSIQDVEQVERAVWEQVAQRGSPIALAFKSMMGAAEQGDQELAQIWFQELQTAMLQKMLELMQLQMVGGQATGGGGSNGGGGQQQGRTRMPTPDVMPPEAMGINSAPNRQAGPLVAPGSPRPGAQIRNSSPDIMGF